jgi:hypothetical protein
VLRIVSAEAGEVEECGEEREEKKKSVELHLF